MSNDSRAAEVTRGSFQMPPRGQEPGYEVTFLRCGGGTTNDPSSPSETDGVTEIVLLHGQRYQKENWADSSVLSALCAAGGVTAIALDLNIMITAVRLGDAFDAMAKEGVLSGKPITLVTPSASGKAMIGLGWLSKTSPPDSAPSQLLKRIVHKWVPVACHTVGLATEDSFLTAYKDIGIPILAVRGDGDEMVGRESTDRLVRVAGAKELVVKGGHACYLDRPQEFAKHVLEFATA
eukprot:CAMPEP_0183298142 /NCGR_PEP_ID=MMETSP0160_2-20130417/5255_1 /TAXON_ID=2839 ORGANISM="Odontella Sinensis, Strain Grunow 1884" /NCGR_SAMPLE_ID=MMETSP0160_2 /ASSEMBLY_ACC=CAM_ASM_000250 /LENGTH=235 /DNA_ID=CAMNT_0025460111 /DNA_START=78 /DNA_END=785 /DNA_ORIENTATION=-